MYLGVEFGLSKLLEALVLMACCVGVSNSLLIMNLISKAFLSLDLLYAVKRNHVALFAFV